jgi:hypothetical protein
VLTKSFEQRGVLARVLTTVGLLTGVLCCAAPFQSRLPNVAIAPSRMVVLPVVVKEFTLNINRDRERDLDTNDAARDNVAAAVRDQMKARGAHVFAPEALNGTDRSLPQLYADLWRWMENASVEIAAQKGGRRDFGRHSVGDWRFHRDLAPLGDALQADTALTLLIRETKDHGNWRGVSAACVVSLRDSRMVWCHDEDDPWGNLKDPTVAQAAVRDLLTGLDAPSASTAGK